MKLDSIAMFTQQNYKISMINDLSKDNTHLKLPKYNKKIHEGLPKFIQKPTISITNYLL